MRNLFIATVVALAGCATTGAAPAVVETVQVPKVETCKALTEKFLEQAEERNLLIEMPIQDQYSSGAVFLDVERKVRVVVGVGLAPYLAQVAQASLAGGLKIIEFSPCVQPEVEVPLAFLHMEAPIETERAGAM